MARRLQSGRPGKVSGKVSGMYLDKLFDKATDKVFGKGPTLSRKRERMEARRSRRFQVRSSVFQKCLSKILSFLTISLRNPQFYTNNLSQSKGRGGSRKSKSRRCSCKGRWRGRENPVVQSDAFHI